MGFDCIQMDFGKFAYCDTAGNGDDGWKMFGFEDGLAISKRKFNGDVLDFCTLKESEAVWFALLVEPSGWLVVECGQHEKSEICSRGPHKMECVDRLTMPLAGDLGQVSIRRIQGVGYGVLKFLGVGTMFDIFQNILFPYSLNTAYCLSWIRRIGLVSFVVFGECMHGYAISSLMDTTY
ncbi:hypothetical protein Tco_0945289 [Tanacetum coccineum]